MASTRAKPLITLVPCQNSQPATRSELTFESRMLDQARLKPASMAGPSVFPARIYSFIRSKMRMLASTAMPMLRMNAATPARVRVTGTIRKIAYTTSV